MPSYALTLPASRQAAAQKAWAVLTLAALWPVWSIARAMPEFLSVGAPAALDRAPGLWSIVRALPLVGDLPLAGLAMTSAIGAGAWLAALFVSKPPRGDAVLPAALLVALTIPALLPAAQLAAFLPAIALAIAYRPRIAALVSGGLLLAPPLGALAILTAIVLIARPFLASPANDNGLPINHDLAFPA